MASRIRTMVLALGEDRFLSGMEEISSAERREIFQALGVPRGGAAASARQRTARRIRAAWVHLGRDQQDEAAAAFARHWLARNRMNMIRAFLDRLEIEHQDGYIRDDAALDKIPTDKMVTALKELTRQHDPGDVRLYTALMGLPEPDESAG